MARYHIKQVPKTAPNADGEWIEVEIITPVPVAGRWMFLEAYCSKGYFPVQYQEVKEETDGQVG